jgi:glycosyltransferase involved in cell wall biosynthesis
VIFGSGFLQETLQEQIRNSGLADTVKLAGFTGELDKYMPYFDVFVQASHTEGLPNVLLEAMAAKTAVIATDVGGTDEVVVDGETGLLIPPNDVDALTVAIERVLSDPTLRQRFGESGCRRVEEHFTFEAQAESYWNLFELVKNNQGHSARFTQSASP